MQSQALPRRVSELASGHTGNVVPRKGLWVRVPCPPLQFVPAIAGVFFTFRGRKVFFARIGRQWLVLPPFSPLIITRASPECVACGLALNSDLRFTDLSLPRVLLVQSSKVVAVWPLLVLQRFPHGYPQASTCVKMRRPAQVDGRPLFFRSPRPSLSITTTRRRCALEFFCRSPGFACHTMPAKLTVLIPCKNERRNIRACIESVQAVADEILIADSGSTDGTLKIVREIGGCRIIEREYVYSANFKNWAIPQAHHEWILLVDADERVTPELAREIQCLLESPPADKDGFWIRRVNHYLGYRVKRCGWNRDGVVRLFRRDKSRYQARWVHAEVDLPPIRVGRLKSPFLHCTAWDSDHFLYKVNRYAGWGALNMRDAGERPNLLAMMTRAPLTFLHRYFLRLGILDGAMGFQVCMHAAYYSFLKQAKLWELHYALPQPDPEAERAAALGESTGAILSFEKGRAQSSEVERTRKRAAAA